MLPEDEAEANWEQEREKSQVMLTPRKNVIPPKGHDSWFQKPQKCSAGSGLKSKMI